MPHRIALTAARTWDVRYAYATWAVNMQWSSSHMLHHTQWHRHSYAICLTCASPMIQIIDFLACMTLKFDVWPRKIIGHLFYTTSSFVYHFKSIGEFKLKLHSGNAQFGSKSAIFLSLLTLKFDGWPWKTIEHLFYTTSSFVHHFNPSMNWNWSYSPETLNLGQNRQFFVPCDLEIWSMTLKNNRVPLLSCFKLCASFNSHQWIQTGVTVRKCPILLKDRWFF